MVDTWEISNGEIQTAQRCPRQWALTYHWKYQVRPHAASPVGKANMGTNIHLALEAYYRHDVDALAALQTRYRLLRMRRPDFAPDLVKEEALAEAMLTGFLDWAELEGMDVGYELVGVEHRLRVPFEVVPGTTVTLRAKLDQVVRRELDGAYYVRDWKTVDALSKADTLVLNQQMRFYAMLLSLSLRDQGIRVAGALYVMLKRSKRTQRATPPFYAQVGIDYNRHDLNSTYRRVREMTRRIAEWHTRLDAGDDHLSVVYPNATDFCAWGCPFRQVCPLMDDGSRWEDALRANFAVGDPYAYYEDHDITELLEALP